MKMVMFRLAVLGAVPEGLSQNGGRQMIQEAVEKTMENLGIVPSALVIQFGDQSASTRRPADLEEPPEKK